MTWKSKEFSDIPADLLKKKEKVQQKDIQQKTIHVKVCH